jgi:hypothetical protein
MSEDDGSDANSDQHAELRAALKMAAERIRKGRETAAIAAIKTGKKTEPIRTQVEACRADVAALLAMRPKPTWKEIADAMAWKVPASADTWRKAYNRPRRRKKPKAAKRKPAAPPAASSSSPIGHPAAPTTLVGDTIDLTRPTPAAPVGDEVGSVARMVIDKEASKHTDAFDKRAVPEDL